MRMGDVRTLTTTYDQIIISATETAPDDKAALFLPKISPHNVRGLDINQVDFVVCHVDEHVFRVSTYAEAGHFLLHHDAVFFLAVLEIVDCDLDIRGYGDEALSVGGDGAVLYSLLDRPGVEPTAFNGPKTELFLLVEGAGDELRAVRGPCCRCHGLGVVIHC